MKINPGFILNEIADETVLINQSEKQTNLARLLTLNASAKLLFERLSGREFILKDVADILIEVYSISMDEALNGAETWIESMKKYHVIE